MRFVLLPQARTWAVLAVWLLLVPSFGWSQSPDVLHYDVHLDLTDRANQNLRAWTDVRVTPRSGSLDTLELSLLQLQVDSVRWNGTANVSFSHNQGKLNIWPASPLSAGDTATARIFYQGNPVQDPSGLGGWYWETNYVFNIGVALTDIPHNYGRAWHPSVDNFTERATYDFFVETPVGQKAVCGGVLVDSSQNMSGNPVYHWRLNQPVPAYLASVSMSDYQVYRDTFAGLNGNVPVSIHTRPNVAGQVPTVMSELDTMFAVYEDHFGPYRWDRVGYTGMNVLQAAMEHATNIAFPELLFFTNDQAQDIIAHELSHHWFGNLVTTASAEEMWINEGFATWSESFIREELRGPGDARNFRQGQHISVLETAHTGAGDGGFLALSNVPQTSTYGIHSFLKGGTAVHTLRHFLPAGTFFPAIRQLMTDSAFGNVSTSGLRQVLESNSGVSLSNFFQGWIHTPGHPHFSLDSARIQGNQVSLHLRQRGRGRPAGSFAPARLPVRLVGPGGQAEEHVIPMSGEFKDTTLTSTFVPTGVLLDPQARVLDARTKRSRQFAGTPTINFSDQYITVNVQANSDTAQLELLHSYLPPTGLTDLPPGFSSQVERYWTVRGHLPGGLRASVTLNYDGLNGPDTSWINQEDSIVVIYRPDPGQPWQVIQPASRNIDFNGDDQGSVTLDSLRKGQYSFAVAGAVTGRLAGEPDALGLFPNPASDEVRIRVPEGETLRRVSVLDLSGRRLREETRPVTRAAWTLETQELPAGVYLLQVETNARTRTGRLIIQR